MVSNRQEKILYSLIREYLNAAEPVSSQLLKEKFGFDCSGATIRNDLQDLTKEGYITQPHTSAGRVPTEKGYKYFIQITFSGRQEKLPDFIVKEIETAKEKINRELELAKELTKELEQISFLLNVNHGMEENSLFDILKIVVPSITTYQRNINLMHKLLKEFENL